MKEGNEESKNGKRMGVNIKKYKVERGEQIKEGYI